MFVNPQLCWTYGKLRTKETVQFVEDAVQSCPTELISYTKLCTEFLKGLLRKFANFVALIHHFYVFFTFRRHFHKRHSAAQYAMFITNAVIWTANITYIKRRCQYKSVISSSKHKILY